jgi:hypothetical protein
MARFTVPTMVRVTTVGPDAVTAGPFWASGGDRSAEREILLSNLEPLFGAAFRLCGMLPDSVQPAGSLVGTNVSRSPEQSQFEPAG